MDAARGYQGANSETGPMGRFLFIRFYSPIDIPVSTKKYWRFLAAISIVVVLK
jgi:hypothetical protein